MKLPSRPKLPPLNIDDLRGHGEELKKNLKKRADLAKGSVANLLHTGRTTTPKADAGDELPARVVVPGRRNHTKSIVPPLDISDDVLNRMFVDSPRDNRRPTSNFFHKQRARAGLSSPTEPIPSPRAARSHGKPDHRALSADDLIYMFAGAPYFDVEHGQRRAQPRVVFGWGPSMEESKYASDMKSFEHRTFELCTRDRTRRVQAAREARHVREVPSMRSAYGKDAGTIGFTHFLEMQSSASCPIDFTARRRGQRMILSEPETFGLCEHNLENVLHRLSELSRVFEMLHEGNGDPRDWSARMVEEIGEDLFSTLLSGDMGTTAAGTGSVSLLTQISALQKVLSMDDVWYDFSLAEERERLPQILWSEQTTELQEISDREVLMLQIAISAELAVRLEIAERLAACDFQHPGIFAPGDLDIILGEQKDKLLWDVVLFRRFIYSYDGVTTNAAPSRPGSMNPLHRQSWNSTVKSEESALGTVLGDLVFQAQHEGDQADGLQAFADNIGWPAFDHHGRASLTKSDSFLSPPLAGRPVSGVSEYDTPLSSPESPSWRGVHNLIFNKESGRLLTQAGVSDIADSHLARSWQSGFVMPSQSVSNMLMNACLERTSSAKHIFGATHTDGFVYNHQMFWSKDCIASRVLAPATGAQECMGWVSLPFVPRDTDDGWIKITTQAAPSAMGEPRIELADAVSRASDPLHSHDAASLHTRDFQQPVDGFPISGNEAQFDGVLLKPGDSPEPSSSMSLAFRPVHNSSLPTLHIRLVHSVHFVSSYPCFPYTKRRRPTSPAYDSHAPTDSGRSTPISSPRDKELPLPPAHPLHTDYTFVVIPAAALLSSANKDSDELILYDPDEDQPIVYHIEDEDVVVLDCRGSPDLEVLARAWCSKVGESAIIGKGGRTCLACCTREAMALGIGVVIRT